MSIGFGDKVKFIDSDYTRVAGIANHIGDCTGHTTPSVTNVEYIGEQKDFALSITLEDDTQIWTSPEQIVLVDHNEGMVMEVGNIRATRNSDGTWKEEFIDPSKEKKNWISRIFNRW